MISETWQLNVLLVFPVHRVTNWSNYLQWSKFQGNVARVVRGNIKCHRGMRSKSNTGRHKLQTTRNITHWWNLAWERRVVSHHVKVSFSHWIKWKTHSYHTPSILDYYLHNLPSALFHVPHHHHHHHHQNIRCSSTLHHCPNSLSLSFVNS